MRTVHQTQGFADAPQLNIFISKASLLDQGGGPTFFPNNDRVQWVNIDTIISDQEQSRPLSKRPSLSTLAGNQEPMAPVTTQGHPTLRGSDGPATAGHGRSTELLLQESGKDEASAERMEQWSWQ